MLPGPAALSRQLLQINLTELIKSYWFSLWKNCILESFYKKFVTYWSDNIDRMIECIDLETPYSFTKRKKALQFKGSL